MRRLVVTILVMAMIMTMAAAPAVATPGSDYFATKYCTIYQGVFIYSRAAAGVLFEWEGHFTYNYTPTAAYWGVQTNDPETWARISWDSYKITDGAYCKSVL